MTEKEWIDYRQIYDIPKEEWASVDWPNKVWYDTSYYNSHEFPMVIPHFLTDEECEEVVDFIENNLELFDVKVPDSAYEGAEHSIKFWEKRTIAYHQIQNPRIRQLLWSTNNAVHKVIYRTSNRKSRIYSDHIALVRWWAGYPQSPHGDRCNPSNDPNVSPWRDWGTLIYLNDDFEGGEIYWPNKGVEFKPQKGALAIHPASCEYLHGVREVTKGYRYTITSFLTYDEHFKSHIPQPNTKMVRPV